MEHHGSIRVLIQLHLGFIGAIGCAGTILRRFGLRNDAESLPGIFLHGFPNDSLTFSISCRKATDEQNIISALSFRFSSVIRAESAI